LDYIQNVIDKIADVTDEDELKEILYQFYIDTQTDSSITKELDRCREEF